MGLAPIRSRAYRGAGIAPVPGAALGVSPSAFLRGLGEPPKPARETRALLSGIMQMGGGAARWDREQISVRK